MVGQIFGKWTVKSFSPNQYRKSWLCVCECGKQKIVRESYLTRGSSKSCGCVRRETFVMSRKIHGLTNTNLYMVWNSMKQRCKNSKHRSFKNYGGRGITIADEWLDFNNFVEWSLSNGYTQGLEIDRKDNNGNYTNDNCRFVTSKVNGNNRRTNHFITVDGVTKTITEWSELVGIDRTTLRSRIVKGLTGIELFSPLKRVRC